MSQTGVKANASAIPLAGFRVPTLPGRWLWRWAALSSRKTRIQSFREPQTFCPVDAGNLLSEIYFKTTPGHTGGLLIEKMKGSGYSLTINPAGRLAFSVKGPGASATVESKAAINDGQWHHALVEADRMAKALTIYVDGRKDASAAGVDGSVSLANDGDVFVGGTPDDRYLDGTLDFLRLAHGTLADADTTIEELYAWEFEGPFLRDFAGRKPSGDRRDAGAIEQAE